MALSLQKKPFPWFDDITGGKQAIFSCFGGTCSNGDLRRWQQSLLLKLWFEVIGILTELEILNDFFFSWSYRADFPQPESKTTDIPL